MMTTDMQDKSARKVKGQRPAQESNMYRKSAKDQLNCHQNHHVTAALDLRHWLWATVYNRMNIHILVLDY